MDRRKGNVHKCLGKGVTKMENIQPKLIKKSRDVHRGMVKRGGGGTVWVWLL